MRKITCVIKTNRDKTLKNNEIKCWNFGIQNEVYLLMHAPTEKNTISFLLPNHPTQDLFFHPKFQGKAMCLTFKTENVNGLYSDLKKWILK